MTERPISTVTLINESAEAIIVFGARLLKWAERKVGAKSKFV